MLYIKPSNITYTEMCIYFDEHFYDKDRNDEICYKYMYLIFYMLACKKKYFHRFEEYDAFSQFAANTIYMRFIRKWSNGERIKSILNYSKDVLYPLKVMYQNEEYRDISNVEKEDSTLLQETLKQNIQSQYYVGLDGAVIDVFENIPNIIKEEIGKTPYKNSKVESKRLYYSCLISLLKSFTLSNYNKKRLEKRESPVSEETIIKMFDKERETSTTVWRMDSTISDYIQVLVNKIRKKISEEICHTKSSYELDDDTLNAILMTAWESSTHNENDTESEE